MGEKDKKLAVKTKKGCTKHPFLNNIARYYSAFAVATLRAGNFSLIRADLPERSRK